MSVLAGRIPCVPTIELPSDLAVAHALIEELHEHVHDLRGENEVLRDQLEKMSKRMYGKSSELLDPSQRLLAFAALEREAAAEEKGTDEEELDAPEPKPTRGKNKKKRRHNHGRAPLPAHLPRDDLVIEPEDTTCPCCSKGKMHFFADIPKGRARSPSHLACSVG